MKQRAAMSAPQPLVPPLARTVDLTQMLADTVDALDHVRVRVGDRLFALMPYKSAGRIPAVAKSVRRGDEGGLYYTTDRGRRIYLKDYQRRQCASRRDAVAGDRGGARSPCRNRTRQPVETPVYVAKPLRSVLPLDDAAGIVYDYDDDHAREPPRIVAAPRHRPPSRIVYDYDDEPEPPMPRRASAPSVINTRRSIEEDAEVVPPSPRRRLKREQHTAGEVVIVRVGDDEDDGAVEVHVSRNVQQPSRISIQFVPDE